MLRKISTLEIRQSLGEILNRVNLRDDQYIIERKGRPLAAVIPIWQLEKWQREKESFFGMIDKVQQKNKKTPLSVIEKDVSEDVKSVRKNISIPEKILLVEDLWDSIASDESVVPVPHSHMEELDRRFKRYESAPGDLLTFDELRARIERRK